VLRLGVRPDSLFSGDGYFGWPCGSRSSHRPAWSGRWGRWQCVVFREAPDRLLCCRSLLRRRGYGIEEVNGRRVGGRVLRGRGSARFGEGRFARGRVGVRAGTFAGDSTLEDSAFLDVERPRDVPNEAAALANCDFGYHPHLALDAPFDMERISDDISKD